MATLDTHGRAVAVLRKRAVVLIDRLESAVAALQREEDAVEAREWAAVGEFYRVRGLRTVRAIERAERTLRAARELYGREVAGVVNWEPFAKALQELKGLAAQADAAAEKATEEAKERARGSAEGYRWALEGWEFGGTAVISKLHGAAGAVVANTPHAQGKRSAMEAARDILLAAHRQAVRPGARVPRPGTIIEQVADLEGCSVEEVEESLRAQGIG